LSGCGLRDPRRKGLLREVLATKRGEGTLVAVPAVIRVVLPIFHLLDNGLEPPQRAELEPGIGRDLDLKVFTVGSQSLLGPLLPHEEVVGDVGRGRLK